MITPQEGVVIAGRYALVRALAKGGMGSVWIAHHRDLEVDVTVKFMAPTLVQAVDARTRFEREAKVAARLKSQHVVQIHDYGVEDGTPYIVMELLTGESLSARITRKGPMPMPTAARIVVQICKALRTAHEAGLVHRDLKPANIYLALKDEEEVVKVLDFGIAKATSIGDAEAETASGVLLGSVHYMSPEQIRSSRTVDHRSDLWSVGVILYRMLTGNLPFPGTDLVPVLMRVCNDPYPRASTVAPNLPERIDDFFERALAREPEQRFQTALELAEAFSAMALASPASPSAATEQHWPKAVPMASAEPEAMGGMFDPAHPAERASPRVGSAPMLPKAASHPDEVTKETTTLRRGPTPSAPSFAEDQVEPSLPTVRKPLSSVADRPPDVAALAPAARRAFPSAADEVTSGVVPGNTVGSMPAMQLPDLRAELAVQITAPTSSHERPQPRSEWLYAAAAALIVLCGSLVLLIRSVMASHGAASEPTTIASATPSIAVVSTLAAPATAPSAGVHPPAVDRPEVSAAPNDAARVPAPPREKSPDIYRGDPVATSSPTAKPKASAPAPKPPASVDQPAKPPPTVSVQPTVSAQPAASQPSGNPLNQKD